MPIELLDSSSIYPLVVIAGIALFAGLIHGALGLGFPMVATPLLSLTYDVRTAILLTLLPTIAVNLASIFHGGNWRQSISFFWPLPIYALIGGIAGTFFIASHDPAPYKLLLAGLIVLYLLTQYLGDSETPLLSAHPQKSMPVFGVLAGAAAGATNVMVPVLIIYTLGLSLAKTAMVQVFNMTFLAGKLAQTSVFLFKDQLGLNWFFTTLPIAVLSLFALYIGMAIQDRIPALLFRKILSGVLVVMALMLVAQYIHTTASSSAALS